MKAAARIVLAALFLAAGGAGVAGAQEEGADYEGVPAYSVARLKIFEGSVWVRTPDSGEWEEYSHNSPVPDRSRISVPEGSEAELQFHGGQFMLLTGGSEVDIRRMGTETTVFGLRSGEIRFDLPESDFAPVRVVVPNDARVSFAVPGKYWLTAGADGQARLVVRAGEGTVATQSGESPVKAGEEALVGRDVQVGRYEGGAAEEYGEPPPLTEQERAADIPPAAAYELREYGEWVYNPQYGYVWRPRVADGWSPYYYGRWEWISPYGWTWVSHEPWGWYPYHFGYWYADPFFGWVWSPFHSFVSVSFVFGHHNFHHFHRRAHFFPARVRFERDGRNVRWVPLRPGERFRRSAFTRSDKRLARWDRRLAEGTVFVRSEGRGGREWRDWTEVRGERRGVRGGTRAEVRREGTRDRVRASEVRPERREQVREVRPETREPAREVRPERRGPATEARPDRSGGTREVRPERVERQGGDGADRGRTQGSGGRDLSPGRERVRERPGRSPGRRMDLGTPPGVRSGAVERGPARGVPSRASRRDRYDVRMQGRSNRSVERPSGPAARPRSFVPSGRAVVPRTPRVGSGGSREQRFRTGGSAAPRVRSGGSAGPRIQGSSGGSRIRSGGSAGPRIQGSSGGSRIRSGGSAGPRIQGSSGGSRIRSGGSAGPRIRSGGGGRSRFGFGGGRGGGSRGGGRGGGRMGR